MTPIGLGDFSMDRTSEGKSEMQKNWTHRGRLEIYGKLLVSCRSPMIQVELLQKAGCHQRDVKYIEDLVRKGCLEKKKVADGDWSRISYTLAEKGKPYVEHFEKIFDLLD